MAVSPKMRRTVGLLAVAAALAPMLGACAAKHEATGSLPASDYRERHPIVLGHGARILDVFVEGTRGFDERERKDVAAFFAEYRRFGNGPVTAQVPVGVAYAGATRTALERIRASAGGRLSVSTYRPEDPALASPIRLSFQRLQAKVAGSCGLWPQDLGVLDYEFNASNQPYWNHGCAVQANVASQIADPIDLVRGRQETPPDTGRRMQNIDKIRKATDPSTTYKQDGQNKINTSIGN